MISESISKQDEIEKMINTLDIILNNEQMVIYTKTKDGYEIPFDMESVRQTLLYCKGLLNENLTETRLKHIEERLTILESKR